MNKFRSITFQIDKELEEEFRKVVGQIYGARKDAIGIAMRELIKQFIQNNGGKSPNKVPKKEGPEEIYWEEVE
ncbi:MAG: hypothetical protein QXU46_06640 [Candidatus Bathyarchaeia archaeon]